MTLHEDKVGRVLECRANLVSSSSFSSSSKVKQSQMTSHWTFMFLPSSSSVLIWYCYWWGLIFTIIYTGVPYVSSGLIWSWFSCLVSKRIKTVAASLVVWTEGLNKNRSQPIIVYGGICQNNCIFIGKYLILEWKAHLSITWTF